MNRVLRIGLQRAAVEIKGSLRNGQNLGFTLIFPIVIMVLFASMFGGNINGTDVTYSQYYVAAIIGSVVMSTGFVSTAVSVAMDRNAGLLKRLAGTPMPKAAFFFGRFVAVFLLVLAEIAILLVLGVAFYHLRLPSELGRWFTFVWVIVLGTLGSTLLGLALGGWIRNAKAAPPIVNLPYVALQFISGIFISFNQLGKGIRLVSGLFPLRWLAQGMRSVFLPDGYAVAAEEHGSWQHGRMALTLLAWVVIGAVLCLTTFRWVDERR